MSSNTEQEIDWSMRSTPEGMEELARRFYPLAQKAAEIACRKLPSQVDADEVLSACGLALLQCLKRFDPALGVAFSTFALRRMRGAILDSARQADHLYKLQRTAMKARLTTENELTQLLGREPTREEVVNRLQWTDVQYFKSLPPAVGSLDRQQSDEGKCGDASLYSELSAKPHRTRIDSSEEFDRLTAGLRFGERALLWLYYERGANMRDIGRALGLSESRVSQLHSQLIEFLRKRMA